MNRNLWITKLAVLASLTLTPPLFAQEHDRHVDILRERRPENKPETCPHCGAIREQEPMFRPGAGAMDHRRTPLKREEKRVFRFERQGPQRDIIIRRRPEPPLPPQGRGGFGRDGGFGRGYGGSGFAPGMNRQPEVRPFPGGERMEHLQEAIRHLHEGGFPDIAQRLERQLGKLREEIGRRGPEQPQQNERVEQLERERDELRNELRKLRREQQQGQAREARESQQKEEREEEEN